MPSRIVQSKNNPRLKDLRRALAHPGREASSQAGRGRQILAGIEGPNLLGEALRAGLRIHSVFVAQGDEHLLEDLKLTPETEVLLVPREILDSALSTESPQPVAALIEPPNWNWADLLIDPTHHGGRPSSGFSDLGKTPPLIVVLAGLQDPGNLGTILRSAEAFGAQAVLSMPGTVSAWNPKAVRASAGSLFRLPLLAVSVEDCFARLREGGVKIWTTTVHGAEPANHIDLAGPVALIIGNEGNGVPEALAARADGAVTIPCPGPVESLNAAAAASVLLYEASRQRAEFASHSSQKARRMERPDSLTRSAR